MYECDDGPSAWTSTCLRQADGGLLGGHAADPHEVTKHEQWAIQHMSYAQNVLVLVHDMVCGEGTVLVVATVFFHSPLMVVLFCCWFYLVLC